MRVHILPVASIVLCLIVGGWFATYGDGNLLAEKQLDFKYFFDAQGESLSHGRLDVPPDVIGNEAFVVEGQYYGYLGITPSLLRLPLNAVFPQCRGRWAPISGLAACALFLFFAYGLVLEVNRELFPECPRDLSFNLLCALFLIALGIGGTTPFLLSRPMMFHEVIIWSVTLGLGSMLFIFRYWSNGGLSSLAAANFLAMLALNARPVAGFAALIACLVMPLFRWKFNLTDPKAITVYDGKEEIKYGLLFTVLALCSYFAVIYAKFKTFSGLPIQYHVAYTPQRLANIKSSMTHIGNMAWNIENYFGTSGWKLLFVESIPNYVNQNIRQVKGGHPGAFIDLVEPFMSVPVGLTALTTGAIAGIAGCIRKGRKSLGLVVLAASTLFGPMLLLLYVVVSYRYFHEYLLFMAIAGAASVSVLRLNGSRRKVLCLALSIMLMLNIAYNLTFSLMYQAYNTDVGPEIPVARAMFDRLTNSGWWPARFAKLPD